MNASVVQIALGELERILSQAKSALRQVEAEIFRTELFDPGGFFEFPRFALEGFLVELHDILLVVLEASEMPEARASLIEAWSGFTSTKAGLQRTKDDHELQYSDSPALSFLERLVRGLRSCVVPGLSSEAGWTLNRLEEMLRATSALVYARKRPPRREADLQETMHDYLKACFPDFRLNPDIGGGLKHFKPDCGIASVEAAIEFKIVHTKEQVAVAFTGIVEDTAGYKGSKDWTRFYAVMYQAQPFIAESHFRADMRRIGAATWTPIVVNGPTGARRRKVTTATAKRKSV